MPITPLLDRARGTSDSGRGAHVPRASRGVLSPLGRGMMPQPGSDLRPGDRPESSRRLDAGDRVRMDCVRAMIAPPPPVRKRSPTSDVGLGLASAIVTGAPAKRLVQLVY